MKYQGRKMLIISRSPPPAVAISSVEEQAVALHGA